MKPISASAIVKVGEFRVAIISARSFVWLFVSVYDPRTIRSSLVLIDEGSISIKLPSGVTIKVCVLERLVGFYIVAAFTLFLGIMELKVSINANNRHTVFLNKVFMKIPPFRMMDSHKIILRLVISVNRNGQNINFQRNHPPLYIAI